MYDAQWGPRRVALKVLHAALVGTGKERTQFLAEAQRLQQIGHPSVVKVLAVGQLPDGRPYLAMEHLEGETLAALINKGALALARALELFGELCSAVQALHERGLVHRDLKPENVFVVGAGDSRHAVLLDFGIAKDLAAPASTTTQEGNVRGTPAYTAPERFFGAPAGLPTDVYELALVLYVMLAGRLPWADGGGLVDPEARLSPRPLVELAPVPEALDVEIRRALSTRAQNRPPSALALHSAVVAAATGGGTVEPTAGETARMRSGAQQVAHVPEQQTPLAWAPTQAAPTGSRRAARKKWPWIAGAAGVAAAGVAFAWTQLDAKHGTVAVTPAAAPNSAKLVTPAPKPDPNDPWATKPEQPVKALPLVGEALAPNKYRAETVKAIDHLPNDTRVVISGQVDELRSQSATSDILEAIGKNPRLAGLFGSLPPCVRAVASDSEWVLFGAPSLDRSDKGTLIVRGRWRKSDVEACFADATKPNVAADGAKLYRIGDAGWLDFIDEHTAYATIRPDLEAEAVHALVKKGAAGPVPHARELLAKLPAERTIAFVIEGKAKASWGDTLPLPPGSELYGWIRVDAASAAMDVAADAHDAAAAKKAYEAVRPQIEGLFNADTDAIKAGKLVVVLDGTVVHVKGTLSALMLSMVSAALSR